MAANDRIFTKDFTLDTLISLCCSLNYFTLLINIVGYATITFGATSAESGLAAGLYVIGGLLSRLFLGKYIELVGRKKMLILALMAAALMSVTYFFISSLLMLYAVRFFHGLTYGLSSTCTSDIVSKLIPPHRRGEGLGYFFLSATISTAVGPLLGLALSADGNYNLVFSVGVVMYSTALALALLMKVPEEDLTEEQMREARSFKIASVIHFAAVPLALVCTVFYFSYSGVHSFIASYAQDIGIMEMASYLYLAISAGTLISRFTTGKIYDTSGPNKIITLGFVSFIAAMAVFSRADNMAVFLVSGFFMGYGMSIVYSICQAIIISKTGPHRYGVATSTFAALVDLGTGIGPMTLGLLLPLTGYRDMYLICAFIALASMIMYWLIHGFKAARAPDGHI